MGGGAELGRLLVEKFKAVPSNMELTVWKNVYMLNIQSRTLFTLAFV